MKANCQNAECGVEFEAVRSTARFCSERCKKAVQRKVEAVVDAAGSPTRKELAKRLRRDVEEVVGKEAVARLVPGVRKARKASVAVVRENLEGVGRAQEEEVVVAPCVPRAVACGAKPHRVDGPNLAANSVGALLARLPGSARVDLGQPQMRKKGRI